jgi:RNA polymerase sigma-70 factor (ECF subfamily)
MSERSQRVTDTTAPIPTSDGIGAATEAFVAHRALLFTVAYEMLGSAADAEDVLQETWLRWVNVDLDPVRDHRAFLVRIATRQSLDRLRTLSRRRESYVGPWLPEPLLTAPDVAENVELAESVLRRVAAWPAWIRRRRPGRPRSARVRNPEKLSRVERETALSR